MRYFMLIDKRSSGVFSWKITNDGQKIEWTTDTAQVCFSFQSKWNQICRVTVLPPSLSYAYNLTYSKGYYPYKENGLTRKPGLLQLNYSASFADYTETKNL